jgi:hypothetical protein
MKKPWALLGTHKYTFLILALFVCLPAIVLEYGMHDDYRYLGAGIDKKDVWKLHPDMSPGVAMGRPVAMFFIGIQSLFTNKISDFIWQRFVFFLLTMLSALCVYYYFTRRLSLDSFFASSLVFCIFALPQSQFFIIWAIWSVFAGPALLLAIISYFIFDYAWNNYFVFRRWKSYAIYLSISFCVFLISLYDYPVMSLFFLVFSCANILFSKLDVWPKTRIRVINEILFCCLGMAFYLFSYKFIYLPILLKYCPLLRDALLGLMSGYHNVVISIDMPLKIKQFYIGSILSLGSIFHPFLDHISALFVSLILTLGSIIVLLGYWFQSYKVKALGNKQELFKLRWIFQMIFTIIIILPLSIAPILAAGWGFTYRVLFPYSAIIVLIMFWLIHHLSRLFLIKNSQLVANSAAFLLVAIFGVLAQTYMLNTALSANRELKFIRQKLASTDFSKVNTIICEKPIGRPLKELEGALGNVRGLPVFGDFPQRHEYDHMATNRTFVVEIFQAVLAEMGIKPSISVISYEPDLYYFLARGGGNCVINMNDIVTPMAKDTLVSTQRVEGLAKNTEASQFVVFKLVSHADGWNILNFYPNFWEEVGEFPHWVSIEFNALKTIIEYALQTGPYGEDDTSRMPRDWLLRGSKDGKKWVDLDKRNDEAGWKNNEKRVYKVTNPSAFKFYQFYCVKGNNPSIIRLSKLELRERQE